MGQDGLQDVGRVPHQRQIHRDVLAHLAGVDVDLDAFGIAGKSAGVERHPVREAGADGDEQVGLVHRPVGGVAAVHAQQAQVHGFAVGQHPGGHQRVGGGDTGLRQQVPQGLAARRAAHAAAEHHQWLAGRVDHGGSLPDAVLVIPGDGAHRFGRLGGELADVGGDILGDVHQHGAFAAALRDAESCAHGIGQVLHPADRVVMLGDGHGHALDIGFLKAVPPQQRGRHVAGEGDHGHAVHVGGSDTGDQIGGAGAAGGQHHAGAAGGAGVTVGRVGRALFMGGQDVADAVGVFVQFIVQVQHRAAGIAENGIHALFRQDFHKDLRTVQFHTVNSSSSSLPAENRRKYKKTAFAP